MTHLRKWLDAATPEQKQRAAKIAKTSVAHLRQLADGHRVASAALARRVERATGVRRESLCPACAQCEFAKRCRG